MAGIRKIFNIDSTKNIMSLDTNKFISKIPEVPKETSEPTSYPIIPERFTSITKPSHFPIVPEYLISITKTIINFNL